MTHVPLWRRLLRREEGQAIAEYSSITFILILGAIAGGTGWPYFQMMINALNSYLASVYYTINLALP